MTVTYLKYEGELASRVRCVKGCGLGKQLDIIETRGTTTQKQVDQLIGVADQHERLHPTHEIEVTFYIKPAVPDNELPIVRQMREKLESLRK